MRVGITPSALIEPAGLDANGHFLQLKVLLYAGASIFALTWLGAVTMVPFGAWAQFKKWFGDHGAELEDDGGRPNEVPHD